MFSSAFLAAENGGVVNMQHILHGGRREDEKMGKMAGACTSLRRYRIGAWFEEQARWLCSLLAQQ